MISVTITLPLSEEDKDFIRSLLREETPTRESKQTSMISVKELKGKVKFPKVHGRSRETVLQILQYLGGSATIQEIFMETDMSESTIAQILAQLQKDKLVDSGFVSEDRRRKRYFLRDEGDPELKELLKNVPRRGKQQ